jgi:DNA-binding response OmpR family regulator/two-component sensor histidine kinase
MLRQAKRLLTLVNQLLELSKLEKGLLKLSLSNDDFNRFVKVLTTSYSSLGYETNIEISYEGLDNELIMWFDKDKVEKIVTNLITNAIKFTNPEGKVSVALRISPTNKQQVELTIKDTGIGIDAENLKYIFNPFYQASLSVNKKFQGTGIGLSLVKELVDLHHGNIAVNSEPGKGSEFIVQLPINKSAYNEDEFIEIENEFNISKPDIQINSIPVENEAISKTAKEKNIILLIEDNEDMRRHIAQNLQAEYQIAEATNGKDGLQKALEMLPDIILSDIMMPGMDGIEMTTMLKKDERTSHIPIVLLTAKASDESKIEGLETHADDYITKPFSIRELSLRIENLIFNRQKTREKFEKNISIIPSEIATNSVDEKFLQRALQIVESHIDDIEYNAEKFCKDIGMSRSNLHRKLIALTNQPVTEFIRTIRIKRAAQLLSNHAGSVSEIAFKTGFGNLSYFTKCFKEQFGTTPSEYVNQMNHKNELLN